MDASWAYLLYCSRMMHAALARSFVTIYAIALFPSAMCIVSVLYAALSLRAMTDVVHGPIEPRTGCRWPQAHTLPDLGLSRQGLMHGAGFTCLVCQDKPNSSTYMLT